MYLELDCKKELIQCNKLLKEFLSKIYHEMFLELTYKTLPNVLAATPDGVKIMGHAETASI